MIKLNKNKPGHFFLIKSVWLHLEKKWRTRFILLLFLMIIVAFAEVLTIGAVLPFLAAITSPSSLFEYELAQPFFSFFQTYACIFLNFSLLKKFAKIRHLTKCPFQKRETHQT